MQKGLGCERGTRYTKRREPYFFDYVEQLLIEQYGVGVYRQGGLKVYTTIDPETPGRRPQGDRRDSSATRTTPASAIVSIDPDNGYIRAMASSGTYNDRTFNLAAQGHRQPGSAFKTMVLTAAVRQGVDPDATYYTSKPLKLNDPGLRAVGGRRPTATPTAATMDLVRATLPRTTRSTRSSTSTSGPKKVSETAKHARHHDQARLLPVRGPRRPAPRRVAARDGARLRDARLRRHPPQADGDQEGRVPRRQVRRPRQAARASASSPTARPTRSRRSSSRTCQAAPAPRRQHRLPGGRQDRHDRQLQRRVVRGLHARSCDARCGSATRTRSGDAQRPRHRRRRRHVPGARSGATT